MEWEKIAIQKMELKDVEGILSIEDSGSLTPWSKKMFIEEMKHPFAFCYILRGENGSMSPVFGYICFRNMDQESELFNLWVHPRYRQRGIGKRLMQFYIDFSLRMGIKTFFLEVHSSSLSAIHLYQYFSYQAFGMRKKFYQGKFDALLMMKKV